jgi:hypothetical protein
MKLPDILLLGFSVALLIIGIDQTIAYGFQQSYWAFMLALIAFFTYSYRKGRKEKEASSTSQGKPKQKQNRK